MTKLLLAATVIGVSLLQLPFQKADPPSQDSAQVSCKSKAGVLTECTLASGITLEDVVQEVLNDQKQIDRLTEQNEALIKLIESAREDCTTLKASQQKGPSLSPSL